MPQISFRASDEMKTYVREAASGEGTTESGIMRRLVNDARTSGRFDRSPAPSGEEAPEQGPGAPDVGRPEPDPEPDGTDQGSVDHGQGSSQGGGVPVAPDPADLGGQTDGPNGGQGDGRGDEGNSENDERPRRGETRGEDEPDEPDDSGLFLW